MISKRDKIRMHTLAMIHAIARHIGIPAKDLWEMTQRELEDAEYVKQFKNAMQESSPNQREK